MLKPLDELPESPLHWLNMYARYYKVVVNKNALAREIYVFTKSRSLLHYYSNEPSGLVGFQVENSINFGNYAFMEKEDAAKIFPSRGAHRI